jgi:hypothetical protein
MRQLLRVFAALVLPLSILASCGTDRESASPVDTALDLTGVAEFCPSGDISDDIAEIFPTASSLRHVATVNCGQVFDAFGKGKQTESVEKAFAFFLKTLEKNEAGQLLVSGAEGEADIVELFIRILTDIGVLPDMDPEDLAEALTNGEYAVGTLFPGGSLLTLSQHAGIADPHGALFGPINVFIVMIQAQGSEISLASAEHPCPAGIEDDPELGDFDCYPLFYDYSVSPASNIDPDIGLQIGQCNVAPVGPEPEIQLLTPEGFLPLDDAPTGIDCTDVEQPEVAMTGWRSYAWTVLEPVAPLLRVTPAFAAESPIGGRISNFSPVAPADPNSGGGIGSISGTIFSNGTELPINGATVDLFTPGDVPAGTTTTGVSGDYSFTELDLGAYQVKASADGFQPDSSAPFTLTEESPTAESVDIGLDATIILE